MEATTYRILRENNPVVLQVCGRAGYENCGPAREFFLERQSVGCKEFIVDLKECRGVDSTFLGILAGLANNLTPLGGYLVLSRPSESIMSNVKNLGLDRLLKIAGESFFDQEKSMPLNNKGSNEFQQAKMILEAHENLLKANPSMAPNFVDVIEFLKEHVANKCKAAQ